jgi:hypothetical protein
MQTQCNSSGAFTPYPSIASRTAGLTDSTLDIRSVSLFSTRNVKVLALTQLIFGMTKTLNLLKYSTHAVLLKD